MGLIRDWTPQINLDYAPTLWRFWQSQTRSRIILGPVGSGKTVCCCANPIAIALQQEPGTGGIRPFKLAVVRNSMPELWRTTIETWLGFYPEEYCGFMHRSTPVSHKIIIPDIGDGTQLHFEAEFFGLDRPDQVKALLSYEPTMIYFNEMREMPKAIVDAAGDRIGRFPSMQKGGVMPTWAGIIGDSNPPDEDHWLFKEYENPPEGWEFFLQPAGVSEVEKISATHFRAKRGEPPVGLVPENMTVTAKSGKVFAVNPRAENMPNLPYDLTFDPDPELKRLQRMGGNALQIELRKGYNQYRRKLEGEPPRLLHKGNYYLSRVPGKKSDWIDGYYRNKFTFVIAGEPVIPEFNREFHTVEHLDVLPDVEIGGGYDMGSATLNPAGVIVQRHPSGIYLVHAELSVDEKIGLRRFGEEMSRLLHEPEFESCKLEEFYGDPAGGTKDGIFAETYFDHLRSYKLPVKEAPTNAPEMVREALRNPMERIIRGRPGILINRKRCPKLVKGLAGAWCFRKLNVAGSDRFATTAEKNEFSHVCEALAHYLLGKGEVKDLSRRKAKPDNDLPAHMQETQPDWNYFGD